MIPVPGAEPGVRGAPELDRGRGLDAAEDVSKLLSRSVDPHSFVPSCYPEESPSSFLVAVSNLAFAGKRVKHVGDQCLGGIVVRVRQWSRGFLLRSVSSWGSLRVVEEQIPGPRVRLLRTGHRTRHYQSVPDVSSLPSFGVSARPRALQVDEGIQAGEPGC